MQFKFVQYDGATVNLSAEIMAKKLIQNNQNCSPQELIYKILIFIAYKYSKVCSHRGATIILLEKYIVKIANFYLAFRCLTGEH